jgi:gamma-glutamyl-gamma-aminobutyrate hydrolase PuuD
VERGTELFEMFGADSLAVNSLHTQFLDVRRAQENPAVLVNATVSDMSMSGEPVKTVEAFTVSHARCAMGFKWHPELMEKEHQKVAFGPFLSACRG